MGKFNTEWEVGPHGAVETIDEGLISVSGRTAGEGRRRRQNNPSRLHGELLHP